MDDVLCDHICRSCLCTKDEGQRCRRLLTALNLQIFVNDIQCVHLLTLILMQTLYLNIEDGIGIQLHAFLLLDIGYQFCLLGLLDVVDGIQYGLIVLML